MTQLEEIEQRLRKLESGEGGDSMAKLKDIDERLSKVKGDNMWRFVVQTILAPLTIVAVGLIVNWQIERNKAESQRVEMAREMIPLLFDDNADKAFATERLLSRIVDAGLATEMHDIVARHYQVVIQSSLKKGDTATAVAVYEAAKSSGGKAATDVVDSIQKSSNDIKSIRSYKRIIPSAATKEQEGFQNLLSGNYDAAIGAFEGAEKLTPGYHSTYEIARLLRQRRAELNDSAKAKEVMKAIVTTHSYGAPPELLQQLKRRSGE